MNESQSKKIASKKVKNLLKTAVYAGRQSHPRNGEHAAPRFRVYRAEKSFFNHFLQNIGV